MTWHAIWLPAAPTDEILRVEVAGEALAAVHCAGRWRVFRDRCTHADCSFSEFGEIEGDALICECHGSEFSLSTGEVLLDPAEEPLDFLGVRRTGTGHEVELP